MYNIKEINYTYLAGTKKKSIKTLRVIISCKVYIQNSTLYNRDENNETEAYFKSFHIFSIVQHLYNIYTLYMYSKNDTSSINSAILQSISLSSLISLNGHFYRGTNVSRASITVNCEVYDVGLLV